MQENFGLIFRSLEKALLPGTKIQPKEEVLGRTSLWMSRQKLRSGSPNPGKKQAFRNGHPARTSIKKLRSEKLRADFSFPILGAEASQIFLFLASLIFPSFFAFCKEFQRFVGEKKFLSSWRWVGRGRPETPPETPFSQQLEWRPLFS